MRILHTSDWHIGRTFHGVSLLDDQRRALSELATAVSRERADVVVVAGDVFDRSIPAAEAVAVYDDALQAISRAGAQIVVTSGNHDSPTRLGAGSSFAAAGGLHVRTAMSTIDEPVVLADEHGEVALYGIPYLDPDTAAPALGLEQTRSHQAVLSAAMDRVRAHADGSDRRVVVIAHAFVSGAQSSESERSISVGGVETVSADTFDGADYVALGHLHSPQRVSDSVRYSGSIMPYSFGERSHHKAALLVDMDADGVHQVTSVEIGGSRGLSVLRAPLEELLSDLRYADAEENYVLAQLTDTVRPLDAMRRLRERFAYAVHVDWIRPETAAITDYRQRVQGRSDTDVVYTFLDDVRDSATRRDRNIIEQAVEASTSGVEVAEYSASARAAG